MATWVTIRNIANNTTTAPALMLSLLDYYLPLAGWTRIGSGTGTAGTFSWSSTKQLPVYPSITGIAVNAWGVWQNASGVMCLFRATDLGSGNADVLFSPYGLFTSAGISATVPPATPLDGIGFNPSYGYNFGQSGYFQFAYTTDAESWVIFGKSGSYASMCAFCLKLEGGPASDSKPFVFTRWCRISNDVWTVANIVNITDYQMRMLVPFGSTPPYSGRYGLVADASFTEPEGTGTNYGEGFMSIMGVDPVDGNHQLFPVWVISSWGAYYPDNMFLRGRLPGIFRVSTTLANGDRLGLNGSNYDYVVIGDYALPWGSSDALS